MLSFQTAQSKLIVEIIGEYTKNVYQATSLLELQSSSKTLFAQVQQLIFSDHTLHLKLNSDPQDIEKEEQKG